MALLRERTIPKERPPLNDEVSANFLQTGGVSQSARRIPYGRNLGCLDRRRYIFFQAALNCTHESESTPFQNQYFTENLVEPESKPAPLNL
jgi:hypothetical protein